MKTRNKIYYCGHCRKILPSLEHLYLVEESSLRGFCTEDCIVDFFTPLIEHLSQDERAIRREWGLLQEEVPLEKSGEELIGRTMEGPQEVWLERNELGEEIFTFIQMFKDAQGKDHYFIFLTFIFGHFPSFVLLQTTTYDPRLVDYYRSGEKIDNFKEFLKSRPSLHDGETQSKETSPEVSLPAHTMEVVEQKKSQYLGTLMEKRLPSDISFEDFPLYESFLSETLQNPDEVYHHTDDDGELIYTYIKSHAKGKISFFYIVLCLHVSTDIDREEDLLVPIISFPSLDGELYRSYKKGEQVAGGLKN